METYSKWLAEHLKAAKIHYAQLCKLDDAEAKKGGSSEYYEQAHQMFGYIAALETCLKALTPKRVAKAKAKPGAAKAKPSTSKAKRSEGKRV